jgi:hypothetical protein
MELARRRAEEWAKHDEDEWHQEEMRLQEEEETRRAAREAAEEAEEERVAEQWEAEKRVLALVLDASGSAATELATEWGTASVAAAAAAAAYGPSASAPEVERAAEAAAVSEAVAELLERHANVLCFDCEAPLHPPKQPSARPSDAEAAEAVAAAPAAAPAEDAPSGRDGVDEEADATTDPAAPESLWVSTSHGLLLCGACAAVHRTLGESLSCVRAHDAALPVTALDGCFAGGNEAFATYLAEEVRCCWAMRVPCAYASCARAVCRAPCAVHVAVPRRVARITSLRC